MSTQTRNSGGGGGNSRNQKKSNSVSGVGAGDSGTQASIKKTDASKTEKEKVHPKPTAEQLRIAQITNSSTSEDPQMREKVATLIEMTQRSEEEVCCALNECDNNLERAVVFLLETLPVGAFETSSKKKKNKAANAGQDNGGGDGEWADGNANLDKREKSRNRSSNRGGRGGGGTDSRGWRVREARENERNLRESRGGGGGERDRDDRMNDNYRSGHRGGGARNGSGGRGGGYVGRGGRGGGRLGGMRSGGRGDRGGGYNSRHNTGEDHQEVELWDNTIAQNAEKQQSQTLDDAWGDWDNEEYVGSLKEGKVFTCSNAANQTAASVVSSGITGELPAPPGLEQHHLGSAVLAGGGSGGAAAVATTQQQQGSHVNALVGSAVGVAGAGSGLVDDVAGTTGGSAVTAATTTPMMQYSAAVTSNQLQQQPAVNATGSAGSGVGGGLASTALSATQYNNTADSFSNAATAAANLVQQVQQQQQAQPPQLKASATLSVEQSQYFNSLTSQNTNVSGGSVQQQPQQQQQQQQQPIATYAQNPATVQYQTSYANVFGTGATGGAGSNVPTVSVANEQSQLASGQQQQVRRTRAKLPPPSKIPSTAVEMPGDTLNNIGFLDVQFGGLDFVGADESFDTLPEKFNTSVTIDGQQQQQLVQSPQDVANDYQSKANVQQQQQSALTAGLQNSQIGDSLANSYAQRSANQQQQQVSQVVATGNAPSNNTLEQLTKNDPYSQTNVSSTSGYQSSYQTTANANKAANAYQQSAPGQGYNNYVQSSVTYGSYQQNAVNSYQQQQQQQQQTGNVQSAANSVVAGGNVVSGTGTAQNIPVGGSAGNPNASANTNTGYLSSGYPTQPSAYQSSQSMYGSTGLSNATGFAGSTSTSSSQYSNFSTSAKLKDTSAAPSTSHYDSVSTSSVVSSSVNSASSSANPAASANTNNSNAANVNNNNATVANSSNSNSGVGNSSNVPNANSANNNSSAVSVGSSSSVVSNNASSVVAASAAVSSSSNKNSAAGGGGGAGGAGGIMPNIQMVSQFIQAGLPYYQQPVYSYEDIQMMQQRVPHVQGYYDMNYPPTSLGAGRDNMGSVAYSTLTDGRFARTDNNSSPVSNVSSTMSQQAGSSGPMLNVPYAYFYGSMPGSFQYGTPTIYQPQIPAANTASGGQFPKPSYNTGYGSTSYDTLSQATQDYTKGAYPSNVNQQTKSQNVANQPQAGTASDITSSMYGKGHAALNKVNSYEKQNFHSGTPPPFNMPNTQTAGGTSAQPYSMYLPMPAAGHHNMIHQPIHQMDGRIHNSSRRDSNSTGQRQQTSSQSKSAAKQGYSPSYWPGQN